MGLASPNDRIKLLKKLKKEELVVVQTNIPTVIGKVLKSLIAEFAKHPVRVADSTGISTESAATEGTVHNDPNVIEDEPSSLATKELGAYMSTSIGPRFSSCEIITTDVRACPKLAPAPPHIEQFLLSYCTQPIAYEEAATDLLLVVPDAVKNFYLVVIGLLEDLTPLLVTVKPPMSAYFDQLKEKLATNSQVSAEQVFRDRSAQTIESALLCLETEEVDYMQSTTFRLLEFLRESAIRELPSFVDGFSRPQR